MKMSQRILYFILASLLYCLLGGVAVFVLDPLWDIFTQNCYLHLVFDLIILLTLIPFVTFRLMERLPLKIYGLLTAEGLKEALKKQVDID